MMKLEELRKNQELIDEIDWDMTHEEAVRLYLEWGNNWVHSNYVIRSKTDVSHYFVLNTWKKTPKVFLIKRNSEDAKELAEFNLPDEIKDRFMKSVGYNKGVYSIDGEVKTWLQNALSVN